MMELRAAALIAEAAIAQAEEAARVAAAEMAVLNVRTASRAWVCA